jgi:geranylgeranyl diphosphate synthase type II
LEAVRYSLFAGGKRLRPALALGAAEVVSGDDSVALPVACALEMIHTYSLIHDDLPAMDDDDLRRGKPTCHKVYGEATAILAGDALLTMAFDAAAETGSTEIVRALAQAAGAGGMVGGQQMDLEGEGKQLDLAALQSIHRAKTGALIQVSLRCGAMAAGATEAQVKALADYGKHLGLAFQITDDILDVVGAEAVLGKPVGSDESRDKSTYPALLGLDESRRLAGEAVASALAALEAFGEEAENLRNLARFVADRES